MKKELKKERIFGLIGKSLSHSFSRGFFMEKFQKESIKDTQYELFELDHIDKLEELLKIPNIKGLNVTIPYKEQVISFLDELSPIAEQIKTVNTIKIDNKKKRIGYNTDVNGFEVSFKRYLQPYHKKALILGSGATSKTIAFVLDKLSIEYLFISRKKKGKNMLPYSEITLELLKDYLIIINATPLGSYPYIDGLPPIPYSYIHAKHYLYDLTYNPSLSEFLKKGMQKNAFLKNGLEMLQIQANCAWELWNS